MGWLSTGTGSGAIVSLPNTWVNEPGDGARLAGFANTESARELCSDGPDSKAGFADPKICVNDPGCAGLSGLANTESARGVRSTGPDSKADFPGPGPPDPKICVNEPGACGGLAGSENTDSGSGGLVMPGPEAEPPPTKICVKDPGAGERFAGSENAGLLGDISSSRVPDPGLGPVEDPRDPNI